MAMGRFGLRGLCVAWAVAAAVAQAQTTPVPVASVLVGEVTFSKGVGFAQTPGQTPRTLGTGLPLREGDRLTTAEGGSAIIRLNDGTRMTLRPQTDLVLERYQYQKDVPDGNMVLALLKGGFRAITGLISKGNSRSAQVRTPTATVGIRGTDFDARVCGTDCAAEVRQSPEPVRSTNMRASAKAVGVKGDISVQAQNGDRRRMVDGGSVYPGDLVETGSGAGLVLAFRDESRVALGGGTRFRVDDFVFDKAQPAEGRFLVSLLKGTVRALTGLIGKARTQNVAFKTPTATIGIRGTGLDLSCADDGCSFFNWLGSITVTPEGHSALQVLEAGQGLFVSPTGMRPIDGLPLPDVPRPDGVLVNPESLFSAAPVAEGQEGLYVFVRDGHIELVTPSGVLHLGRGEVGLADAGGRLLRPALMPRFIELDPTPRPDHPNPLLASILGESGIRASNQCR
jgi:hypothetical protein